MALKTTERVDSLETQVERIDLTVEHMSQQLEEIAHIIIAAKGALQALELIVRVLKPILALSAAIGAVYSAWHINWPTGK